MRKCLTLFAFGVLASSSGLAVSQPAVGQGSQTLANQDVVTIMHDKIIANTPALHVTVTYPGGWVHTNTVPRSEFTSATVFFSDIFVEKILDVKQEPDKRVSIPGFQGDFQLDSNNCSSNVLNPSLAYKWTTTSGYSVAITDGIQATNADTSSIAIDTSGGIKEYASISDTESNGSTNTVQVTHTVVGTESHTTSAELDGTFPVPVGAGKHIHAVAHMDQIAWETPFTADVVLNAPMTSWFDDTRNKKLSDFLSEKDRTFTIRGVITSYFAGSASLNTVEASAVCPGQKPPKNGMTRHLRSTPIYIKTESH